VFTPTGILRMSLDEDQKDNILDVVRGLLEELKV